MSFELFKKSLDILEETNGHDKTENNRAINLLRSKRVDVKDKNSTAEKKKQQKHVNSRKRACTLNVHNGTQNEKNKKLIANIRKLNALSGNELSKSINAEKLIKSVQRNKRSDATLDTLTVAPATNEESIFTEEDFRKFEEEYTID